MLNVDGDEDDDDAHRGGKRAQPCMSVRFSLSRARARRLPLLCLYPSHATITDRCEGERERE